MTARRDPAVDALRAVAVAGVVLGHWFVTAPTSPDPVDGSVGLDSPLRTMPELAPASWLFQSLGLFFLVAGFAAARSRQAGAEPPARWWWCRARRLAGPVGALAGTVAAVTAALALSGAPPDLLSLVPWLALSPLWFLAVYLVLLAATPVLIRLDAGYGARVAAMPAVLAIAAPLGGPTVAATAVLTAWWVPWQFGIALARRPLRQSAAAALLGAAAAGVVVLVLAGLPATAVGVPGAARSNLDPPSAATVALALAQCGLAALGWPLLTRLGRGRTATLVTAVNRAALPVFLLYQSALVAVWLVTLPVGPLPGLHDVPAGLGWLLARIGWLPVFGAVLAVAVHRSAVPSQVPATG